MFIHLDVSLPTSYVRRLSFLMQYAFLSEKRVFVNAMQPIKHISETDEMSCIKRNVDSV